MTGASAIGDTALRAFASAMRRWHFYAGVIVAPVFLIAAVSGIVMSLNAPIERALYSTMKFVAADGVAVSAGAQLQLVASAFPDETPATYIPPASPGEAAQFILTPGNADAHGGGHEPRGARIVFVDPYRRRVTGFLDPQKTPYAIARKIHGTLLLGKFGDYVLEIAAGFGVLLAFSGLLVWTSAQKAGDARNAAAWRNRHVAIGPLLLAPMLFFLLSGLAWTPFWGEKLVQAWSSFPAARLSPPLSVSTHSTLEHGDHRQVSWALAQTPMPVSQAPALDPPTLDRIAALAGELGFGHFRINFPAGEAGVWTISATTIGGDLKDPRRERTVHVDQYSGAIIADVGFSDYSLAGKAMAAAIPLHQASLGGWNLVFNLAFCAGVIVMVVSSTAMWMSRRRPRRAWMKPPPHSANSVVRRASGAAVICMSLLFPLSAAVFIAVVIIDTIATTRAGSVTA